MLWQFTHETLEDEAGTLLHRPGCAHTDMTRRITWHPATPSIRRDVAPRECWACQPDVELRSGRS